MDKNPYDKEKINKKNLYIFDYVPFKAIHSRYAMTWIDSNTLDVKKK